MYTDNEVLEVQVPPRPGKQAAVLRALRSRGLLQQAVCASRLGYTQSDIREPSSKAGGWGHFVAQGGPRTKDFNQRSYIIQSLFIRVPGLTNGIELMA